MADRKKTTSLKPTEKGKGGRRGSTTNAMLRRRRISLATDDETMGELVRGIEEYYEILEVLGKGAYGTVYRCRDVESGSHYAIKIVELKKTSESSFNALLYEVGIMKRLHHSSIVRLKRVMRTDAHMYIVMELCEFELRDRISSHHPLSEDETRVVMRQLLDAVSYLHSIRIAHRDLKPANILLVADDLSTLKVSDFGLSYRMDSAHAMDDSCGTPAFMAPEVINSRQVYSEKCDVWSLGVIMYVLLAGKLPFRSKSSDELFALIQEGNYVLPDHISLSSLGSDLLSRLLAVNPIERYSATEARDHPWIHGAAASDENIVIQPTMFEMLLSFKARARLRKVFHVVLASVYFRSAIQDFSSSPPPASSSSSSASRPDTVVIAPATTPASALSSGDRSAVPSISIPRSSSHDVPDSRSSNPPPPSSASSSSLTRSSTFPRKGSVPSIVRKLSPRTSNPDMTRSARDSSARDSTARDSSAGNAGGGEKQALNVPSYMRATTASSKKTRGSSPSSSSRSRTRKARSRDR